MISRDFVDAINLLGPGALFVVGIVAVGLLIKFGAPIAMGWFGVRQKELEKETVLVETKQIEVKNEGQFNLNVSKALNELTSVVAIFASSTRDFAIIAQQLPEQFQAVINHSQLLHNQSQEIMLNAQLERGKQSVALTEQVTALPAAIVAMLTPQQMQIVALLENANRTVDRIDSQVAKLLDREAVAELRAAINEVLVIVKKNTEAIEEIEKVVPPLLGPDLPPNGSTEEAIK